MCKNYFYYSWLSFWFNNHTGWKAMQNIARKALQDKLMVMGLALNYSKT